MNSLSNAVVLFLVSAPFLFSHECVKLIIEPGKVVEWDVFVATAPRFSIALDGYVAGATRRNFKGPYANFNHHEDVDRLSTSSTAEQVYLELNMGLFETFRENRKPRVIVHVDDCDEDVCAAVWLLRNFDKITEKVRPRLERFLVANDRMDRTAGTYPLHDPEQLAARDWLFEPYRSAKMSGLLSRHSVGEHRRIIDLVGERIGQYLDGKMPILPIKNEFDELGGGLLANGNRWRIIEEKGSGARIRLVREGTRAFVAVFSQGRYSIGRTSQWVPFPLEALYEALNAAEPQGVVTHSNRWGGSDLIGGSPRESGSKLSIKQIEDVINKVLRGAGVL